MSRLYVYLLSFLHLNKMTLTLLQAVAHLSPFIKTIKFIKYHVLNHWSYGASSFLVPRGNKVSLQDSTPDRQAGPLLIFASKSSTPHHTVSEEKSWFHAVFFHKDSRYPALWCSFCHSVLFVGRKRCGLTYGSCTYMYIQEAAKCSRLRLGSLWYGLIFLLVSSEMLTV